MEETSGKIVDVTETAREIVHAAQRVVDLKLKVNFVGEKMLALTDEETLAVIRIIYDLAWNGDEEAKDAWAMLANPETFAERLDPFRKSRIYHLSVREDNQPVQALFSKGIPARTSSRTGEQFQIYGRADLTLGERLTKAHQTDRRTRNQISYDMNPRVIDHLLQNLRTTEADVVRIAARRPADARVLEVIFRNKKWIARYMVKLAIARNPYTPANLSRNILPQLLLKDLLEIRDDSSLHGEVRQAALELISRKREKPKREDGLPRDE